MLIIRKEGSTLEIRESERFLDPDYTFSRDRIHAIWKNSGLTCEEFAKTHKLGYAELRGWLRNSDKYPPNNPCPASRVKLAFIEAEQRRKLSSQLQKAA